MPSLFPFLSLFRYQGYTTAQRLALSASPGTVVFDKTLNSFFQWNGSVWLETAAGTANPNSPFFIQKAADQILAPNFIINSNTSYQPLTSGGGVVLFSDATTPIQPGTQNGQFLVIENATAIGSGNIFVLRPATGNIHTPYDLDLALYPGDAMIFIWNGTKWNMLSIGSVFYNDFRPGIYGQSVQDAYPLVLGAGFTINPANSYVPISSAAPVTSSAVTAINPRTQFTLLTLINVNAVDNITFKNNALLKLPGAVDFILKPSSTISFMFDGTNWITTGTSTNV